MNVIYAASFLHLFDWDDQVAVSTKLVGLLSTEPGSIIFGHQMGYIRGQRTDTILAIKGVCFLHDVESFKKLWEVAGQETTTKRQVNSGLEKDGPVAEAMRRGDTDRRLLRFRIERT